MIADCCVESGDTDAQKGYVKPLGTCNRSLFRSAVIAFGSNTIGLILADIPTTAWLARFRKLAGVEKSKTEPAVLAFLMS